MSKYYGTVQGNRGEATRTGSAASGIRTCAQSWDGSVIVFMSDDENGEMQVRLDIAEGSATWGGKTYFSGTLEDLKAKLTG